MKRYNLFMMTALVGSLGYTATAQEEKQTRPNILFCVADDASYDHFGANGCSWVKTPNFDRVAKEGIRFTNAYTPNPKCSPSRSCIITGRNPWQLEAAANHWPVFPAKFKSVIEALRDNGYETALTGKGWGPGDVTDNRQLIGKTYNQSSQAPTKQMSKIDYAKNFRTFLDERETDKPFFFWYGCKEPHRAYEFQSGVKKGGKRLDMLTKDDIPSYWPDTENVRHDMLDYAFELEWCDTHLGRMLAMLEEENMMDNTLILVTSDNGMPFPRVKGHPYQHSSHMPLVAMWKGKIVDPGRICDQFVSFTDFAPTFLEVAGISQAKSGMKPFAGRSLIELFEGKTTVPERKYLIQGRERNDIARPNNLGYPVRSIRVGNLFYLYNFNPELWPCGNPEAGYLDTDKSPTKTEILNRGKKSEYWQACFDFRTQQELYNVDKNPNCMNNLAQNPEYQGKMAELKKQLFDRLKAEGDPRMGGKDDYFDKFPNVSPRTYETLVKRHSARKGDGKKSGSKKKRK